MSLSDDFIRHELRSLAPQNMTRSRSQSTDSVNESVKSTINETKQSIYIDEILQDDIGHNFFCLSCCFKFEDSTSFVRHFGQHHLNQVKLTCSQEQFLKHNSFDYHFLSILIDFRIKSKFLRKYSHDLIVLNEETAFMLDELNKEENEEDDSDPSDKELSVHDENNLYDSRPKLSLLFVDFSIIKSCRIFSYLKDLFVKSYPVFKNSSEISKEVVLSDDIDRVKESNENKNPKKTSSQVFHSRNACKKLKCPKCNWHYKYRETLDIHMKEKHSTDLSQSMSQQCVYCIENIQHPRLGRGEQYKCGYKPYRCDICDYSTTTKGNLSIHMQSDKHVNNLKEIGSKSQEKSEAKEVESNDIRSIDLNRKFVNKKYLNSKMLAGNLPQDHSNNSLTTTSNKSKSILPQTEIDISLLCPLCYIGFNQQTLLENHLKESHCVVNEDTIKNLLKTGPKTEQNKTMKTSSDDELINKNQENEAN
ncbi:zinc finger homeobox 4-like [Brachionus plicatilis]|uniref:Zinc finger homeobox 4-like n=1 Tax=Brachionus plicatilis TaxID=10195 RepID=A0A3M7P8Q2_BRAPC|nr:zinc finger homeobox 4-like [Brachionus plicatilis]